MEVRRVEEAVAAAHHRASRAEQIVGKADARPEVVGVGLEERTAVVDARELHAPQQAIVRVGLGRIEVRRRAVALFGRRLVVVTQTEVQRQPPADLPVVLHEAAHGVRRVILGQMRGGGCGAHRSQQERGEADPLPAWLCGLPVSPTGKLKLPDGCWRCRLSAC